MQGDVREHLAALEEAGARAVRVRHSEDLARVDGIVLPGGESTTIVKLLDAFELFEPLRTAIEGGLPAYGSCAGMILLARRLLDAAEGQRTLGAVDGKVRCIAFGRQYAYLERELGGE